MRKLPITLVGILAAASAFAQFAPPLHHVIESRYQQSQPLTTMSIQQGASLSYRVSIKTDGKWWDLDGLTARWDARETSTNTSAYTASSSATVTNVTPNYFQIDIDNTQTGTAFTNWVYSVIVLKDGDEYPQGEGRADVPASAWTGASGILTNVTYLQTVAVDGVTITGDGTPSDPLVAVAGSGDMIGTNNLSDVASASTSRDNLGLGTSATNATGDFATAAQGALADSAIQTELDPVWGAVSNTVTTGAALGATATQPADLAAYVPLAGTSNMTGTIEWDSVNVIGPDKIQVRNGTFPTAYQWFNLASPSAGFWRLASGGAVLAGIGMDDTLGTLLGPGNGGSVTIGTNGVMTADEPISAPDPVAAQDLVTKAYGDANYSLASFQGPREDLSTTTALTWLPTKYSAKWSPSAAATFAMSTDADYPRATYSLWVYSTDTITFDANIELQNSITPSGTNLWVIAPADTTTNWVAVGRAF